MNIAQLTDFFMWMSILTGGIIVFWGLWLILAPDFVYKTQNMFMKIERDYFNKVIYAFFALAKLFLIFFCLAPYVALLIIA